MIIEKFDSVIGIITTNDWICWRSLDERLISGRLRPVVVADVERQDVVEEPLEPGLGPAGLAEGEEPAQRRERADGDARDGDQHHPEPQHVALVDAAVDAVADQQRHRHLADHPEQADRAPDDQVLALRLECRRQELPTETVRRPPDDRRCELTHRRPWTVSGWLPGERSEQLGDDLSNTYSTKPATWPSPPERPIAATHRFSASR